LEAYVRWLEERTKRLVLSPENWATIEALAQILVSRRRMTASQVKEMVKAAHMDEEFQARVYALEELRWKQDTQGDGPC